MSVIALDKLRTKHGVPWRGLWRILWRRVVLALDAFGQSRVRTGMSPANARLAQREIATCRRLLHRQSDAAHRQGEGA